jgi:hypothetical protein
MYEEKGNNTGNIHMCIGEHIYQKMYFLVIERGSSYVGNHQGI